MASSSHPTIHLPRPRRVINVRLALFVIHLMIAKLLLKEQTGNNRKPLDSTLLHGMRRVTDQKE